MAEGNRQLTAVVLRCSDPRLEDAAASINQQLKLSLGVGAIIPLTSPGVVGLYARRPDSDDDILLRDALEVKIKRHMGIHWPSVVAIAAHHDCIGCPGNDAEQEQYALAAAESLRRSLRQRIDFVGDVRAVMLELHPNPGWKVKMLG